VNPGSTTKAPRTQARSEKDEDKANLLDEHSARGDQNRPDIAVTGL